MKEQPIYNRIGKTYDSTRKADPNIVATLLELLQPKTKLCYLDIGCGSGNYTGALRASGFLFEGLDISEEMLAKARKKYPHIVFHHDDARHSQLENNTYDGATCILATHHIKHLPPFFAQTHRVLRQGRLVIFTATPLQMQQYWLNHYFPQLMQNAIGFMTEYEDLSIALEQAGFCNVQKRPFFVTNTLEDWFLHAGKYRPEIYLDPVVRDGISSFHLANYPEELQHGLLTLQNDIQSGKIDSIIQQYESDLGDYLFISADKK